MDRLQRRAWFSWASLVLLASLCGVVAVLQYRWIGEISQAERERLQEQLHDGLDSLRARFNEQIFSAAAALAPSSGEIARLGPEGAYAARYARWNTARPPLFRRLALALPRDGSLVFEDLDFASASFHPAAWPADWSSLRDRLAARMNGSPAPPSAAGPYSVIEIPHFADGGRDQDWLLLDLNLEYVRTTVVPALLRLYLGHGGGLDYEAIIDVDTTPPVPVFASAAGAAERVRREPDASVALLQGDFGRPRGGPPAPGDRKGPHRFPPDRPHNGRPPERRPFAGSPPSPMQRAALAGPVWTLSVRHKAGSLEALVEQARRRNLAISAGLLLLIVATVGLMVRFSRQAQHLAELQMNFVAGVSHELRTPLTVIRTAAYNLRGRLAARPEHVERYGRLIQEESEKLQALVEQVLRFASAKAGVAVRRREPVPVADLIGKSLPADAPVEIRVHPDLPPISGDAVALQHALANLVDNALKYGAEGGSGVGIFAAMSADGQAVEIRVVDGGPGIPFDEQQQIFDPFYRGRRAVSDQIHGTGLGLALVKDIVEAHGGAITVKSEPANGTEFIVRLPAFSQSAAAPLNA